MKFFIMIILQKKQFTTKYIQLYIYHFYADFSFANELKMRIRDASLQMTIEMYPSDQVADLRAEVTHWYENLQKEQMNQQAQLQEFGQSGRQQGDFPGGTISVQVSGGLSLRACV